MAHELDITDGQASFVSAREDAWHQLGTVLPDTFTAEEAMRVAHLGGWNVRHQPLFAQLDDGTTIEVPERRAVVRDNPIVPGQVDLLGTAGTAHHIIQNEQHTEFLNTLVDESGAHFETAGALQGGRKVFVSMRMPGHIKIGGVDPINMYITAVNAHDNSMSFTFMVSPVRPVCANTLNLAFRQATNLYRIRHTSGARKLMVAQARQALDFTFGYLEGFQEEANQLVDTTLTQQRFEEIIQREFGAPDDASKATITRAENRLDDLAQLFAEANTQEGIRFTAWAGLNALTEYADHFAPTRGDDREAARAANAVLNPRFKNRALDLMLAVR